MTTENERQRYTPTQQVRLDRALSHLENAIDHLYTDDADSASMDVARAQANIRSLEVSGGVDKHGH